MVFQTFSLGMTWKTLEKRTWGVKIQTFPWKASKPWTPVEA